MPITAIKVLTPHSDATVRPVSVLPEMNASQLPLVLLISSPVDEDPTRPDPDSRCCLSSGRGFSCLRVLLQSILHSDSNFALLFREVDFGSLKRAEILADDVPALANLAAH